MRTVKLEHITVKYETGVIFDDFSYTFEDGQCCVLTGASGRGKTTLLKIVTGLLLPDAGAVCVPKGFRFSAAFQEDRLLPALTATENLLFALPKGAERSVAKAESLLGEILPAESLSKRPAELSGGMRRRVSVARALFAPSDAVILDEPFAGLDDETARLVSAFIAAHRADRMLLLATHRPDLAPPGSLLAL